MSRTAKPTVWTLLAIPFCLIGLLACPADDDPSFNLDTGVFPDVPTNTDTDVGGDDPDTVDDPADTEVDPPDAEVPDTPAEVTDTTTDVDAEPPEDLPPETDAIRTDADAIIVSDVDIIEEPDADASEMDTDAERDADVERDPDTFVDADLEIIDDCFDPFDPSEPEPVGLGRPMHESFLAGTNVVRSEGPTREMDSCADRETPPFGDCEEARCECTDAPASDGPAFVLCGLTDPDFHTFSLLRGDRAWVRVLFGAATDLTSIGVELEVIGGPGLGEPNHIDTGGAADADAFEWVISSAGPPSEGILVQYQLFLRAIEGAPHDYRIAIQVDSSNRDCPHDVWDADWDEYDLEAPSELGCTDEACEIVAGTLSADPAPVVSGNLCGWDGQDFFAEDIPFIDEIDRYVTARSDNSVRLAATYQETSGDGWSDVGELTGTRRSLSGNFFGLSPGRHQLAVTGNGEAVIDVGMYLEVP